MTTVLLLAFAAGARAEDPATVAGPDVEQTVGTVQEEAAATAGDAGETAGATAGEAAADAAALAEPAVDAGTAAGSAALAGAAELMPQPLQPTLARALPGAAAQLVAPAEPAPLLEQPAARAAAGAGVAAAMSVASLGLRPLLALVPLYSRLERSEILNHPTRRELLRVISEEPGVNITDLHARFNLGWGSMLYHLQRLEAQGLVVSHRWGRSRRYFLQQGHQPQRAEGIRVLKAENARALAQVIYQRPGCTQEELADLLQLSKSVVSKYATRLANASLVERQVGRNCLRLFPTGKLRELLAAMPESPAGPAQVPTAAAQPAAHVPASVHVQAPPVLAATPGASAVPAAAGGAPHEGTAPGRATVRPLLG